jgi:hypothetical protein
MNSIKKLKFNRTAVGMWPFVFLSVVVMNIISCNKGKGDSLNWIPVDQGALWTEKERNDYYTWNQGSILFPYSWLLALKDGDGKQFLSNSLERYGFLPIEGRDLPVGLSLNTDSGGRNQVGLTCAACHTRQIKAGDEYYRIDGGPSLFNAELFTTDLDAAFQATIGDSLKMKAFYDDVLYWSKKLGEPTPPAYEVFKTQVSAQQNIKHQISSLAFPTPNQWGLGRIDALNQIFNRLGGIDLAVPPAVIVPQAIVPANIPVRPPFLWNAPKQDYTQWAATSANGNDHQAMMRNVGEVIGVGGVFKPVADNSKADGIDFLNQISINFDGIQYIESLVKRMGPPRWPWKIDQTLAKAGKIIYESECTSCHGIKQGEARPPSTTETWATPLINVETDATYYNILGRTAPTGVLSGVLGSQASLNDILNYVTVKIIEQKLPGTNLINKGRDVMYGSYEARVLEGIWAAAPYLHNGSVPTLDDLLKPAPERPVTFYIGPEYDIRKVGLSMSQEVRTGYDYNTAVPGNSNVGHEYGTQLGSQQKAALLEYLKTL